MLERDIEAHLVKLCRKCGILCEKFTSPQRRSVPDRILTWRGRVVFVELKAPGKSPTEAQVRDHDQREAHGAQVCWTDSVAGVESLITTIIYGHALYLSIARKVIV